MSCSSTLLAFQRQARQRQASFRLIYHSVVPVARMHPFSGGFFSHKDRKFDVFFEMYLDSGGKIVYISWQKTLEPGFLIRNQNVF